MKKLIATITAAVALAAIFVPAATAKPKKAAGPVVVGTDEAGDWGSTVEASLAPVGDALGQDLAEASISADAKNVNFVIKVTGLPPTGGIPEFARYSWDFTVNGEAYSMSGNFTDYVRGVCYPPHTGTCPPPKDPGQQPFFVRNGPCTIQPASASLGECNLLATVKGTFDTAAGTITIPVPMEVIKAKAGSKIGPGTNAVYGATIYATPAAVSASPNAPHDVMTVTGTYTIPKVK